MNRCNFIQLIALGMAICCVTLTSNTTFAQKGGGSGGGGGGGGGSLTIFQQIKSTSLSDNSFVAGNFYYGAVTITYYVDSKSSIKRNGVACQLSAIQANDSATFTFKKDSLVVSSMSVTGP